MTLRASLSLILRVETAGGKKTVRKNRSFVRIRVFPGPNDSAYRCYFMYEDTRGMSRDAAWDVRMSRASPRRQKNFT